MGKIGDYLKRLPAMDAVQLREEWFLLFYTDNVPAMSSRLMRLALAHRIQELEYEASARMQAIREKAAAQPKAPPAHGKGHVQRLKPGTRLLREHGHKVHEVLTVENGCFVYEGQLFKSLSAVTRKITGTPRSGAVFFGLKGRSWRGLDG